MEPREILAANWDEFFDSFSRRYHGQRVSVTSAAGELGVEASARNLPLLGITAQTEAGSHEMEVMLGELPDRLVTYVIRGPASVRVCEWSDHASIAIEVVAEDGTSTLVKAGPVAQALPLRWMISEDTCAPRKHGWSDALAQSHRVATVPRTSAERRIWY